jgi:hypothetical protein
MTKKSKLLIPLALIIGLVSGVTIAILLSSGAFADKCVKCYVKGGDGGDGGDGGKAIAAEVGPGGSCVAIVIGDSCGGSSGSSEPRGGQGGDGGAGGDVIILGDKISDYRNSSSFNNSSNID